MSKICIISVYLGKLPDTYPLWLKSVKWNKSIDFLFVTDIEIDEIPSNMIYVKMTLDEIKQLAEQELGMEITLLTPYKLCDYRPAYGLIFRKYLRGYDYWGHCDMDLMFGDLKSFFKKWHLYKYDKFLHKGHLALYRNTDKINSAYKLPGSYFSYKKVFSSNDTFVFDENNRINSIFHHNRFPIFEKTIFANINPAYTRYKCCNLKNYKKQLFYYDSGKIFRAFLGKHGKVGYEEFIYIHLLQRKHGVVSQEIIDADRFAFTENGYSLLERVPDADMIKAYTKNQTSKEECIQAISDFKRNWLSINNLKVKLILAAWQVGIFRRVLMRINSYREMKKRN